MGIIVKTQISKVDDPYSSTSLTANQTLIKHTYNGVGSLQLVFAGDGDNTVNEQYIIDGGTPVTVTTGDVKAEVVVGFKTSLVIQSVNTSGTSKNDATCSAAGVIQ